MSHLMADAIKLHTKRAPTVVDTLKKFIAFKIENPARPYNNKDYKLSGKLAKFSHVHLAADSLLIYYMAGNELVLIDIVDHTQIAGKHVNQYAKKIGDLWNWYYQ